MNPITISLWRRLVLALVAVLPGACALAPPNEFAGAWATADRREIDFRDDTVVINPPGEPPTAMGAAACEGAFRFAYGRKSREALLRLAPRQPDLTGRLAQMLVQADYPVAELSCGPGDSTYVLLGDRDLVAIYRDRDIAGMQRWSRL